MPHLSIGEVLGLLLEEFPDVTISKIRFLESQGLIDPERTPSGYRKFYDDDVELLRCILREQRENYLPLRVIKDRIDSGEIDPTGEQLRPRGIRNVGDGESVVADDVPVASRRRARHRCRRAVRAHRWTTAGAVDPPGPARAARAARVAVRPSRRRATPAAPPNRRARRATALAPGELLDAHQLCSMSGISRERTRTAGSLRRTDRRVVRSGWSGSTRTRSTSPARPSVPRRRRRRSSLRGWRVAADREARTARPARPAAAAPAQPGGPRPRRRAARTSSRRCGRRASAIGR